MENKQISMMNRLAIRTLIMAALTVFAFAMLEVAAYLVREQIIDHRFVPPELAMGLKAAAILAWAEISGMWFRIIMQPRADVQMAAEAALQNPMAAALLFWAHQFSWAIRTALFIAIYGVL